MRPHLVGRLAAVTDWTNAWIDAAELAVLRADHELADDGFSAACQWYLRAAECYRLACHEPSISVEERRTWIDSQASAFRAALPLLDHPATAFTLNVDRTPVAGYLFRPDDSGQHRRTALCPAAPGEIAEAGYVGCGTTILGFGINYLTYSLVPAAPSAQPVARASNDDVLESVLRWACRQPGVDQADLLVWPAGRAPA